MPRNELSNTNGPLTPLPFKNHIPNDLHAILIDIRNLNNTKTSPQKSPHRHGRSKPHTVQPVINPHPLFKKKSPQQQSRH